MEKIKEVWKTGMSLKVLSMLQKIVNETETWRIKIQIQYQKFSIKNNAECLLGPSISHNIDYSTQSLQELCSVYVNLFH